MLYVIANSGFFDLAKAKERGFNSVTEMNEVMIKNWNETVKEDDTVLCLDKFFKPTFIEQIKELLNSLNGDVNLITDDFLIREFYAQNLKQLSDSLYIFNKRDYYDHIDVLFCPRSDNKESKKEQYKVVCCGGLKDICKGKYLNVDADRWDYCPVVASEVKEIHKNMNEFFKGDENEIC